MDEYDFSGAFLFLARVRTISRASKPGQTTTNKGEVNSDKMNKLVQYGKNRAQRLYTLGCVLAMGLIASTAAYAQTDIDDVLTSVSGYKTTAITLAIAILLFVIGRRLVGKLAK